MSNSSSAHQLVQGLGGSFFHWISAEVFPYVLGSTLGICVLMGVALNVALLVVYCKRKLYKDPTNDFIPQIAVVDLLASFLVLIPSVVAAIMGKWPMPEAVCQIHGVVATWFQLLSFALIFLIFVERVIKAWKPTLHDVTFNHHTFVIVISVVTWGVDLIVSILPVLGVGTIIFDEYQHQCSLDNEKSTIQMHVIFALGIYSSPLVVLISFSLLLEKRRRNILSERAQDKNKLIQLGKDAEKGEKADGGKGDNKVSDIVKNGPSKAWTDKPAENGKTPLYKKNEAKPGPAGKGKSTVARKASSSREEYRRRMTRPPSQNMMHRIFRDSEEEKDHHQAMTALITWSILFVCWVWFMVACLLDVYSSTSWGGWYTLGVLLADATYCIKPIIYLAHNRHYRKAGTDTVPTAVKEKAVKVKQSVSNAVDTIDKTLFHSPGATKANKFQASIAAQMAIIRWKRKAKIGIGKFGFGKKKTGTAAAEKEGDAGKKANGAADSADKTGAVSQPTTTTALASAALLKLAETKTADTTASKTNTPGTPSNADTTKLPTTPNYLLSPASSTPGSRPATNTSVVLSVGDHERGLSPRPSSAARSGSTVATLADPDNAQEMSPFSPQM